MMNIGKKRAEYPVTLVVVLIGAAIALLVSFGIFYRPAGAAARFFSTQTLQADDSICKIQTQKQVTNGLILDKNNDADQDGRLDKCDICVKCNDVDPKESDNDKDSDGDGMPDYCDENKNDRTIVTCKSSMKVTNDGRCVDKSCPYT